MAYLRISMRKITLFCLFLAAYSYGQSITDTLVYMQYNVLNYRNITDFCTVSNNNPNSKEGYMRTLISYINPDIIALNEMAGDGGTAARRMLDNGLNANGINYYKQAAYTGNSSLTNMLYYNENKLALHSQDQIERGLNGSRLTRLVDVYNLYYLDQSQLEAGDTIWLTCYVTHFKASTGSTNVALRATAAAAVMDYHETNYDASRNYIISGDFNMYTSNEQGFINLVGYPNRTVRFRDPINKPGSWNNSGTYASIHTQSTRTTGGCHSGGGLDDRFDFVLCGQELIDNDRGMEYIPGSYTAVGNDGNQFNGQLTVAGNTSAPAKVIDALFNLSDHLPVTVKLGINRTTASVMEATVANDIVITNPVEETLYLKMQLPANGELTVRDLQGKVVEEITLSVRDTWITKNVSLWAKGTYYVTFWNENGTTVHKKIVKL